jgi:hypothetical protein
VGVLDEVERGMLAEYLSQKHAVHLWQVGGANAAAGLGKFGAGAHKAYSSRAVDEGANDEFELGPHSYEIDIVRSAGPIDEGLGLEPGKNGARNRRVYTLAKRRTSKKSPSNYLKSQIY